MKNPYEDIINLPHPTLEKHPRMSMIERAAQFSPFAALTGYEDAIDETARLTDSKIELSEDEKAALDQKLRIIAEDPTDIETTITYFVPDARKAGGAYEVVAGPVKKIDSVERIVAMADGTKIPIEDIIEINFR